MGVADPVIRYSRYRWVVLASTWGAFVISIADRQAWSNVAANFGQEFRLPVAALGIFASAFLAGYVLSNVAGGLLADWIGSRRLIAGALLPMGLLTFLFSTAQTITAGLIIQACMGLLAGADYAAGLKLVLAWFRRSDRGLATGLFMTATSSGVALANLVVPTLLVSIGWQNVYRVLGIATAMVGVLCWVLLRDAPPGDVTPASLRPNLRPLLRDRDFLLLALAGFGGLWGTWGFAFWANALMVRGHGISVVGAGLVVASFGLGGVVGKPLIGLISDLIGGRRKLIAVLCLAIFAVSLLVFGSLETAAQFRLVAPVLGAAAFVYTPMLGIMVAETAGPPLAGSALGITNATWQLGSTVAPLGVGLVYGATGSFSWAFVTLAAGPALAVIVLMQAKERPNNRDAIPIT